MKKTLLLSMLGLWLLVAPGSFGYQSTKGGINDSLCGIVLILLGIFLWRTGKKIPCLIGGLVGIWLQLAPLFFWEPKAFVYLNDTITGVFTLIIVALISGFYKEDEREEAPSGWSFNPSSWGPRLITVFLAGICWFLARYMACYQLGYITHINDPFFGEGTVLVITSSVSKMFPISDAGLGAFVYTLEFLLGWMGGVRRWKTMPWLSVLFGAMVVPAGLVSILLIVSQPVFVGAWCGICLAIAVCMLMMIVLTVPEVVSSLQLLRRKMGKGFLRVFWKGDFVVESLFPSRPIARKGLSAHGISCPWNLLLSIVIGVWLMCAPSVFAIAHPAADGDYLVGPLLIAFSVLSLSEVVRSMRFVNALLGIILFSTPFWLVGFSLFSAVHNGFLGVVVFILSLRKGMIRERYGR